MNDRRIGLLLVPVGVAVLWIVLGMTFGWPRWLWIVLAVLSVVLPWVGALVSGYDSAVTRPAPPIRDTPPARSEPTPLPERKVTDVLLPSARDGYRFVFACTVSWSRRPDVQGCLHADPGALASDIIVREAATLTAAVQPEDVTSAQYRLAAVLGTPRADHTGGVRAWASRVSLNLCEEDSKRLRSIADTRKDGELFDHRCGYERKVRTYLTEDVLTSLGSALAWWLADPPSSEKQRVNEAAGKIDNLRALVRSAAVTEGAGDGGDGLWLTGSRNDGALFDAAGGRAGLLPLSPGVDPPPGADAGETNRERELSVEECAVALVECLPDEVQRAWFAARFARLLHTHGYTAVAAEIRDRFDSPERGDEADAAAVDRTPAAPQGDADHDGGSCATQGPGPEPACAANDDPSVEPAQRHLGG